MSATFRVSAVLAIRMSRLNSPAMLKWWKKELPFQMSNMTAVIRTASTTASRRAFSSRELVTDATLGSLTLATSVALTRKRLRNCLSETEAINHQDQLSESKFRLECGPTQEMVRTAGFEPALPIGKRILSPQRLPFRHVRLPASATVE